MRNEKSRRNLVAKATVWHALMPRYVHATGVTHAMVKYMSFLHALLKSMLRMKMILYDGGESHRLSLTLPPHRLGRSQSGEDRWRKAKAPSPDVWLFKDDPTCCRTILEEPAVWNRRRRLVLFTSLQLPSPRTFSNLDEQVVHVRTFLSQFRATNIGARSAAWFVFAVEETF